MKKIFFLICIAVIGMASESRAQFTRYIVRFKDKGDNPYSLSNPSQYLSPRAIQRRTRYGIPIDSADLPITPRYLDSVRLAGAVTILNTSKWLNQVAIKTTDAAALAKINSLPFVVSAAPIGSLASPNPSGFTKPLEEAGSSFANNPTPSQIVNDYYSYGQSFGQVHLHNGEFLHNRGFRGAGMQIAVLDAGFYHYLSLPTFDSIRNNGQVLGTWDFVTGDASVDEDHTHGMNCLSTIAANMPGTFVGTAPKASFYLYRTEDAATEYPIEEQNWAAGAERADSVGVDVCSVSLGYSTFDNATFNHTYADMNGDVTIIARAADIASKKGMIIVVAAGNEGSSAWHYISSPADADSVIAVGAVNVNGVVAGFSSYGPSSDGQVKPAVAAVGSNAVIASPTTGQPVFGNGTSFACPNMAGLVTCLWQAFPEVNNMSIISNLEIASNRYSNPDDRTGYGIPNMKKAFVQLIKQLYTQQGTISNCVANLQWAAKTDSVITIEVERKLPSDPNYITLTTKVSTGAFALRNFSFQDNLSAVANGLIKYRFKMNIATDTTFYLDSLTINHSQNCSVQPTLAVTAVNNFGALCLNTPSDISSFSILGTNLPAGNVNVGPLTGFSFATTVNGTYTPTLALLQTGGTYSQVIYLKFIPTTTGSYNGNIPVSCGSTATALAVSGSGINTIASMNTIAVTAASITTQSATVGGQVTNTGCSPVVLYGIEYHTISGLPPGSGTKVFGNNIAGSIYSVPVTGLTPGTTYYYRAFGINNGGTAYGQQLSFTTRGLPADLFIYNTPSPGDVPLHYSIGNLQPGHYSLRIINSGGQVMFSKEMDITTSYIDATLSLPVHLATGVYTMQVLNPAILFKQKKSFVIR